MFFEIEWSIMWVGITAILASPILMYVLYINLGVKNNWTPRVLKLLKDMPAPNHVFILGALLEFRTTREEMFNLFRKFAKRCPRIYQFWLLNYATVNLLHPDDIEKILTNNNALSKGDLYQILDEWLKDGLLTSTGSKWHQRRKLLTPAFHFSILKKFTNVFAEQSLKAVKQLKKHCGNSPVNITEQMTEFTIAVISETAMGYRRDINENTDKSKPSDLTNYKNDIYRYVDLVFYILFRPWLFYRPLLFLTPPGRKVKKTVASLQSFTKNVIKKRMEEFDNSIVQNIDKDDNDTDVMTKKRLAMLDLLISQKLNGGLIDDEGIAEEVDTFMFEGHDTTTSAISFALMLLANHKDIQDRVYDEVISIMGEDRSRLPNYNDLQQMVYLERCIKESLRLYPPVWFIARKLDAEIALDDYLLPTNIEVFIHIYDLHRHPDFWPNPNVFDPDRFLPENTQKRHPFAYIPFSAGSRNCIGQRFALLEEKALISTVLRNFILEPVDTPDSISIYMDLILRVKDGLKLKIHPRP